MQPADRVAAMVAATAMEAGMDRRARATTADRRAKAARTAATQVLALSVAAGTVAAMADVATRAVVTGMVDTLTAILAALVGL